MSDNPWPIYNQWIEQVYQRNHEKRIIGQRQLTEEEYSSYDQLRGEVKDGYRYFTSTENGVDFKLDSGWQMVGWIKFSGCLYILRKRVKK